MISCGFARPRTARRPTFYASSCKPALTNTTAAKVTSLQPSHTAAGKIGSPQRDLPILLLHLAFAGEFQAQQPFAFRMLGSPRQVDAK